MTSDAVNVPLDPDDDSRAPATFTGSQFERLIDAIRGNAADRVEAEAEIHARAMKKQLRPENETHPDMSVFNPRGERDHPRPALVRPVLLGPYPLERDTLLWKEIELLNQLEPGSYEVTKADGSVIPFHVVPRYAIDGRTIDQITLRFPCDDDQKHNFPSFVTMLKEVIEQQEVRKLTAAI